MALNKPLPSPLVIDALRDGLPAFLAGPSFGPVGTVAHEVQLSRSATLPTYPDVLGPHLTPDHDWQEVFVLGLSDLQAGKDLKAAKSVAWRCFAGTMPGPLVACYVAFRHSAFKMTALTFGTRASNSLTDSEALDSLPQVQTANYDLRFLRIPGINLELFWLVSLSGASDLIIPSPSGPAQLQRALSNKPFFTSSDFLSIVRSLASKRLAHPATMGS
ncbi:MAG TPA: hypothetical protein VMH05_16220 [Bryobacteraceae bacterium]|nr:hypothetical protein [Bryobacteraceae bacterium]